MTPPVLWGAAITAGAVAVSPLLAGWSAALAGGVTTQWWRPRRTSPARWAILAVVVAGLGIAVRVGPGTPWPAWALLVAGGAVLSVVDVQVHQLPARFLYPLAAAESAVLIAAAALEHDVTRLLRVILAAGVTGLAWLAVVFLVPAVMGLGDVRLLAVTAGLLGWTSWEAVVMGQLAVWALAGATALVLTLFPTGRPGRLTQVPLGPSIIAATVLVSWL